MRVTGITIYPIKGCGGVSLPRARVEARGLALDRRFLVAGPDGHFLSQRRHPQMALLRVAIACEELVVESRANPTRPPLRVPVSPPLDGPPRRVIVWRDEVEAIAWPAASAWLEAELGVPCELVHQPETTRRQVDPRYGREGDVVSFADGFPVLLTSEASLAEVSARVGAPMAMGRFRPNVVVDGEAPFAEETWTALRVGSVPFRAPKGCDRCQVPNVDPETGEPGLEPLRALSTFRKRDHKVWFGMNLVPDAEGEIAVGDAVIPDSTPAATPL